jgi:ADP-dependent NAD(P)H-hydrate dehydratase / NAD(P)H-hydrate epimerase
VSKSRRRRIWLVVAGAVAALVLALALAFPPLLRSYVVSQARQRGVDLTPGEVGFHFDSVSVDNATFRLIGFSGLTAKLKHGDVALSGLNPKRLTARGLDLEVQGAPETVVLGLTDWFSGHKSNLKVPFSVSDVTLEWRAGGQTWLSSSGGAIAPAPAGLTLHATRASISGIGLGAIDVGIDTKKSQLTAAFGGAAVRSAPVHAVIAYAGAHPSADFTLARTDLSRLTEVLGAKLPFAGVRASGKAHASIDRETPSGPITGTASLDLTGFVPPHPDELNGIVFGNTTTVKTKFVVTSDRKRLGLSDIQLTAGAFKLGGTGLVTREARLGHIQLNLSGKLACTAIATSAAQSRLGGVVGAWLLHATGQALEGSITVVVQVDAYTDQLAAAKVARTISVGCGLKPLALPGVQLPSFNLGKLPRLPALPKAPSSPHGPSLPPFPSLPGLGSR